MSGRRLASLDILRGADMFLLLFLGPIFHAICEVYPGSTAWLAGQTEHVAWEGFVLWDIIMPLFLFMSGVTIPFSMAKYKEGVRPDGKFYLKLLKRFCLLFFLGWIVQASNRSWMRSMQSTRQIRCKSAKPLPCNCTNKQVSVR